MGLSMSSTATTTNSSEASRVRTFQSSAEWNDHFKSLKDSSQLMVIDFSASWCGPCRFVEPAFIELADKYTDVVFVKIDVDDLKDVAQEFGIQAMPTFVLVKQGKEIDKIVGAKKAELESKIVKNRG